MIWFLGVCRALRSALSALDSLLGVLDRLLSQVKIIVPEIITPVCVGGNAFVSTNEHLTLEKNVHDLGYLGLPYFSTGCTRYCFDFTFFWDFKFRVLVKVSLSGRLFLW
ncbi:unnamed protein product [Ectocarpus sp. 4 AP-2014]